MTHRNATADDNQQTPPRDAALIAAARQQAVALDESNLTLETTSRGNGFTAPPPDSFTGYRIIKEVHRGGQGVVYQAINESTSRKVAIKVMRQGPFADAGDRARFDREVQILAQLNHANIVSIHDRGTAAGCEYFVMDYVSGQPLDVYMASGRRTIDDSLRLFLNICDAINAAHLHGVIHRDIKPSNIRIDAQGRPHILDFGLAKTTGSIGVPPVCSPSTGSVGVPPATGSVGVPPATGNVGVPPANPTPRTITGQFIGSLPWASPEQAEGSPSKIDIRTDVYSLGVVLYQMLTGKFPYEVVGNMRDVLGRIINEAPQRPRAVRREMNDEVETIILKCLAKEPDRRYQSAGELAKDVDRYLTGEPIE
ncbi:MAG: protein kinase, partial [Planctomycetes bacterium]|nr:protein kinase [Planctomycetota bacterium]